MNGDMPGATAPAPRLPPHASAQIAVIAGVLVLALAWMQPDGGAGLGFLPGLLFHGLHIGLASAVAWWCSGWLLRTPVGGRGSPWPWLVLAGALAGAVLAPVSLALEHAFGMVDIDRDPAAGLLGALWHEWSQVVPITALLWPVMNLLVVWRQSPAGAPRAAAPTVPPSGLHAQPPGPDPALPGSEDAPPPSFLDRLPAALGRDVVWLQAQEHYLSVTTTQGRHLLLQALAPAVDDLARLGVDGMQTHRSTWVAWAHVLRLDTRARSPAVVLRDGTQVALGRRRLPQVVAAWTSRGVPIATLPATAPTHGQAAGDTG